MRASCGRLRPGPRACNGFRAQILSLLDRPRLLPARPTARSQPALSTWNGRRRRSGAGERLRCRRQSSAPLARAFLARCVTPCSLFPSMSEGARKGLIVLIDACIRPTALSFCTLGVNSRPPSERAQACTREQSAHYQPRPRSDCAPALTKVCRRYVKHPLGPFRSLLLLIIYAAVLSHHLRLLLLSPR